MSDEQALSFTPIIIGIAGIIAASAAFYFLNEQSPREKAKQPQETTDIPLTDSTPKETQKRRVKKKKETPVSVPTTVTPPKEETLPKAQDIIKEEPKPQTEAPHIKEQTAKEAKQTTEETNKAKKKKNKNKPPKPSNNDEQRKQLQQKQQKQTLLQDVLTSIDDGEWEEVVKFKKTDKDKTRKLQEKIQRQHDEYLSQF